MARARNRNSSRRNPIANDNISRLLDVHLTEDQKGSDRFLDIVTWNIKFFNNRDSERVRTITSLMQEINADLFICQEIELGALDSVASRLNDVGAGFYKTAYGSNGGDQRVAFMYDTEWVKASTTPSDLFAEENVIADDGKEAFPRYPLHSKFVARTEDEPFDFHLVGVHLKSQRGGSRPQRQKAAERLAEWLTSETTDEDVIIAGDWNNKPSAPEWDSIRKLEQKGEVIFADLNPENEASHLSVGGRRSKLDLVLVSEAAKKANVNAPTVLEWSQLQTGSWSLEFIVDRISDHLPTLVRFYFNDKD